MENQNNESQSDVVLNEHDQAMVDKVDSHEAGVEDTLKTDEEIMLAGKYKSVDELEKAYEHLQSKMGKAEEEEGEEVTEASQSEEDYIEDTSKEIAQEIASEAGIDYSAMQDEYQESGSLSQETYDTLSEAGIPTEMVDAYIAGQEALSQNTIQSMYSIAGGEQEYGDMVSWAQENLRESEIEAFNNSLINESTSHFAINGLYARYNADKGPNLVKGSTSNRPSGGFASTQEMMVEMAKPQYKKDPAFRAEVQRRVAVSNF